MKFGPRRFDSEERARNPIEGPTQAELDLMQKTWFHGSSAKGIKTLRKGGVLGSWVNMALKGNWSTGIFIDHEPYTAEIYGKHISEWKLLRPLRLVTQASEMISQKEAKQRGYAGYYFQGYGGTHNHGLVFNGRDLEKVGEKTKKQREKEDIARISVELEAKRRSENSETS